MQRCTQVCTRVEKHTKAHGHIPPPISMSSIPRPRDNPRHAKPGVELWRHKGRSAETAVEYGRTAGVRLESAERNSVPSPLGLRSGLLGLRLRLVVGNAGGLASACVVAQLCVPFSNAVHARYEYSRVVLSRYSYLGLLGQGCKDSPFVRQTD